MLNVRSSVLRCAAAVPLLAAAIAIVPDDAHAQSRPSFDARTWRPATDPNASLVIEPTVTPGPGIVSFGAWSHYSYRPIVIRKQGSDDAAFRPLEHVLGLDAVAQVGIGQRLALGLS